MIKALIQVAVTALGLLLIAHFVPGIAIASISTALIVAVLWGLVMLIIRPILGLLTLPITLITFGLSSLLINALLFWLVSVVVPGFMLSGFIPALEGSVLLTLVGWVLHMVL